MQTPETIAKSTGHTDHSPQQEENIWYTGKHHSEGVRSNRQTPELASSPLREGLSSSDGCSSQARRESRLSMVRTNQEETSSEYINEPNGQESLQDELQ